MRPTKSCAFWCRHHEALGTANAKYKKKKGKMTEAIEMFEASVSAPVPWSLVRNQNLRKCTINLLWWQSFSTLQHIFCIGQYESNKRPSRGSSCFQYFFLWTEFLYINFFFFQRWILAKPHAKNNVLLQDDAQFCKWQALWILQTVIKKKTC